MNKYVRAMYCVPTGFIKMAWTKLFHINTFNGPLLSYISPLTEITIEGNGKLSIGKMFKMRDGSKIRVRNNAECIIGNDSALNSNNFIVARERIELGNNVWLSPNVQIYDHDHDFRIEGGLKENKYTTSPVKIGNNVWIGANTVILKGTTIGDNSVIGAGCILKGDYPEGSIIVQKRNTENLNIKKKTNAKTRKKK